MNNIEKIDKYVSSMTHNLKFAKKQYQDLKRELLEYGHPVDRPRCTYTLCEVEYAIKLINLKMRLQKEQCK